MGKTLKQYIEENNYLYDLSLECGNELYKSLDTIERYFVYTAYTSSESGYEDGQKYVDEVKEKYDGLIDPDGSANIWETTTLIYEIYRTLWNLDIKENNASGMILEFNALFGGDVMNSIRTNLNTKVRKWYKSKILQEKPRGRFSKNYLTDQYAKDKEKIKTALENEDGLINSLWYYHTLGNFVLVPYTFNGFRGSSRSIRDYFDRSLKYLKNNNYKGYNKKDFYKYVNYFFLWDYLKNGKIKKISNENYFKNINAIILRRGEFMFKMLKLASENKELYNKIRQEVFLKSDGCYDSLEEVEALVDKYTCGEIS